MVMMQPKASGIEGFNPYWCPSPFPSTSILGVFHLSAIGFQSCFFFTADVLGEFPGLALVPDVVVPEVEQRCAWNTKLDPNFCHARGRTSDPWMYQPRGVVPHQ